MFDTGGRQALFVPADAQVAQIGGIWQIVDGQPGVRLVFEFGDPNAVFTGRQVVLLLAGDFAGMAARAIVVVDQQSVFSHGSPPRPLSFPE